MAHIQATIFFDKRYWVGTFERTDKEGYAIARHIFGGEPTDPEVGVRVCANPLSGAKIRRAKRIYS